MILIVTEKLLYIKKQCYDKEASLQGTISKCCRISAIFVHFSKPNNPRGLLRNGAPLATPLQGHHSTELARLAHLQEKYNYIRKSSNCLFNITKISFLVTSFADPG